MPLTGVPAGIIAAQEQAMHRQLADVAMRKEQTETRMMQQQMQRQQQMQQIMAAVAKGNLGQQGQGAGGYDPKNNPGMGPTAPTGDDSGGPPKDPFQAALDTAQAQASALISKGLTEEGSKLLEGVSRIKENSALSQEHQANAAIKSYNTVGSLLNGVHDDASYKAAIQQALGMGNALPPQVRQIISKLPPTYDADMVGRLKSGVEREADRARAAAEEARAKHYGVLDESERIKQKELYPAQAEAARRRNTAKGKAGDKLPAAAESAYVRTLIGKDFNVPDSEAKRLSTDIAEEAKKLMEKNHLDKPAALQAAYAKAKERGDFGGFKPARLKPGTLNKPLDMPESEKDLKDNTYYWGPDNSTWLWSAKDKKFKRAGAGFEEKGEEGEEPSPDEEESE